MGVKFPGKKRYVTLEWPLCCENTCILCHSFSQNDHFRTMGHTTKLTFCHKIIFFAELKCVYKASLINCLHTYVNNSIYVFEPKFTKSRPMLSLNEKTRWYTTATNAIHYLGLLYLGLLRILHDRRRWPQWSDQRVRIASPCPLPGGVLVRVLRSCIGSLLPSSVCPTCF